MVRKASSRQHYWLSDFGLPGIFMFGRYQFAASQMELRPHAHAEAIEICFLERGEQTYRVGGQLYRMRGNDQFFTLPGEIHDTARLPQERGILYWLILKLGPSGRLLGLAPAQARQMKRELLGMPRRHFQGHADCAKILGQISALLAGKKRKRQPQRRQHGQLRIQALLLEYLTLTIEASQRGAQGSATLLMQRVLDYIERHLDVPISVPRLAEIARLSESRLKARFKREIGVPPAEFWLRKKIERAVELLAHRTVTEVAHELGFSSSQYFATAFRRYTRKAPSRFRPRTP